MIYFKFQDIADQKVAMVINGKRVSFRFRYNVTTDRWSFDLSIDGNAILHGRRIVTGIDLIGAFGFGIGRIFAYSETGVLPNRDNMINGAVKLYSASEEEIENAAR